MPQGFDCVAAIIFQPRHFVVKAKFVKELAHYRTSWCLCLFLSLMGNTATMTVQPTNINIGSYNSKLWQRSWAPSSRRSTNLRFSPLSPFFRAFLGSKGKTSLYSPAFFMHDLEMVKWQGRKGLGWYMTICCIIIYQILSWPSEALSTDSINCPQSPCSHILRISQGWLPTFSVGRCFRW